MPNGPIKPPVVWHLDTDQITPRYNSPVPDRLTQIRLAWEEFEASDKPDLQKTLHDIELICKGNSPTQ